MLHYVIGEVNQKLGSDREEDGVAAVEVEFLEVEAARVRHLFMSLIEKKEVHEVSALLQGRASESPRRTDAATSF